MKKIEILSFVVIVLAGCQSATPMPTATPTATLMPTMESTPTPTQTLTPTLTLTITPTLTQTPTFPSSFESFKEEVKSNCARLPEESGIYSEDQKLHKISLLQDYFLSQIEGRITLDIPVYPGDTTKWDCRGEIIVPNEHLGTIRLSNWGRWAHPVTLAYWSSQGLVRYDYIPDPNLLLTPTPTKGPDYFPKTSNDFRADFSEECGLPNHILEELKSRGITEENDEIEKSDTIFELLVKDIGEYVGRELVSFSGLIEARRWFCVCAIGTTENVDEDELFDNWGEWQYPVYAGYYTTNGLVVYKYEPATVPAP